MPTKLSKTWSRMRGAVAFVSIPTLATIAYYGFFASDIYVSEATIAVRSPQIQITAAIPLLASPVEREASLLREQITGHAMVLDLNEAIGLKSHYQSADIDFLSRLSSDASQEDFLEYAAKRIHVGLNSAAGTLTVRVEAFDPAFAKRMNAELIAKAEEAMNATNDRIARDLVALAESEVRFSEARLTRAIEAMSSMGAATDEVDPQRSAGGIVDIILGLEREIALNNAEISRIESFARQDSPQLAALRNKARALEAQIADLKSRFTGDDSDLASALQNFRRLQLDVEFAQNAYAEAQAAQDRARTEANSERKYVVTLVEPSLPEEAVLPERLIEILKIFALSLVLWLIGRLLLRSVLEHGGL